MTMPPDILVGTDCSVEKLLEMASWQKQKLDEQQSILANKTQQMNSLQMQQKNHKDQLANKIDRLASLRERIKEKEARVKKMRLMKTSVQDQSRINSSLSTELELLKKSFDKKELELSSAISKMESLTNQLKTLHHERSVTLSNTNDNSATTKEHISNQILECNLLNEENVKKVKQRREVLVIRQKQISEFERKIVVIRSRLYSNRETLSKTYSDFTDENSMTLSTTVDVNMFSKCESKYKTLPANLKFANIEEKKLEESELPPLNKSDADLQKDNVIRPTNNKEEFDPMVNSTKLTTASCITDRPKNASDDLPNKQLPLTELQISSSRVLRNDNAPLNKHSSHQLMNHFAPRPYSMAKSTTDTVLSASDVSHKTRTSNHGIGIIGQTVIRSTSDSEEILILDPPAVSSIHNHLRSSSGLLSTYICSASEIPRIAMFSNDHSGMRNKLASVECAGANEVGANLSLSLVPINQDQTVDVSVSSSSLKAASSPLLSVKSKSALLEEKTEMPASSKSVAFDQSTNNISNSSITSNASQKEKSKLPFPVKSTTNFLSKGNESSKDPGFTIATSKPFKEMGKADGSITSIVRKEKESSREPYRLRFPWSSKNQNEEEKQQCPDVIPLLISESDCFQIEGSFESPPVLNRVLSNSPSEQESFSKMEKNSYLPSISQVTCENEQVEEELRKSESNESINMIHSPVDASNDVFDSSQTSSSEPVFSRIGYRYAPKAIIADAYMRKLGNRAKEEHSKSLTQLYGKFPITDGKDKDGNDFVTKEIERSKIDLKNEKTFSSEDHQNDELKIENELFTKKETESNSSHSIVAVGPSIYRNDGEKLKYKVINPRPVRRRMSSGDMSDDYPNKSINEDQPHKLTKQSGNVVGTNDDHSNTGSETIPGFIESVVRLSTSEVQDTVNKKNSFSRQPFRRQGNLKRGEKPKLLRRVSFEPVALLLDAALEGELDVVEKTAREVPDVSAANDEGITALHNAICAGHFPIVKFLVEYGCDVNTPDSDGWTPLHCAASCNNLFIIRFLVEHGACVFATTFSDSELASDKCEEDEDGYETCLQYLRDIQDGMGVVTDSVIYAVFDYIAENPDELSFRSGDKLIVLRKGDEFEQEWWWSCLADKEGYVPRNLVGLFPRVVPQWLKSLP